MADQKPLTKEQSDTMDKRQTIVDNTIHIKQKIGLDWIMVINTTFNTICVIPWRSVLLGEETGENPRPAASQ